jgi:hypothetical protein
VGYVKEEGEDDPQDYLMSCLAFVGALSLLLKEGEGVIVKTQNGLKELYKVDTLMVWSANHQIHIGVAEDKYKSGQMLWVHEDDVSRN